MIRLTAAQIDELLASPESGIGFQVVEVETPTAPRSGLVFNAELLLWEDESTTKLSEMVFETALETANRIEAESFGTIRVVPASTGAATGSEQVKETATIQYGAKAGSLKQTGTGQVFQRFTAYRKDRRITTNLELLPATFATTDADSQIVRSGSQAVCRYALPNPMPAIFRFRVDPTPGTQYRQGVVQRAYGHVGGGVEVVFDNGTNPNSVTRIPVRLPL